MTAIVLLAPTAYLLGKLLELLQEPDRLDPENVISPKVLEYLGEISSVLALVELVDEVGSDLRLGYEDAEKVTTGPRLDVVQAL